MSWSLFHTKCMALTGMTHVSRVQYSQIMSSAYHESVVRHFDTLTAGGRVINTSPKLPLLNQGFLATCEMNLQQHQGVNWLQQIGKYIISYWTGAIIVGPTGTVTVTSPGSWLGPPVVQNLDFNIILYTFEAAARIHIMSLTGIYVSSVVPGVTSPWSGALLQTIP